MVIRKSVETLLMSIHEENGLMGANLISNSAGLWKEITQRIKNASL